jgi:4-hydroxy-4-methyl-2-oxoglutarate aldolase
VTPDNGQAPIDYLGAQGCGVVTDALAKLGLLTQGTFGIFPLRGFEDRKVAGRAVTVKFGPPRATEHPRPNWFSVIDLIQPGDVLCVQAGLHLAFTGDVQASMAKRAGATAMILDGSARDAAGLRQVDLPVWAKQLATRLPRNLFELVGFNLPVELGGVQVLPGDVVVADEDGVVVVPGGIVERVADLTREVVAMEAEIEEVVASGGSPSEVANLYAKKGAPVPLRP